MSTYLIYMECGHTPKAEACDDWATTMSGAKNWRYQFRKDIWIFRPGANWWWILPYEHNALRPAKLDEIPKSIQLLALMEG